ncbi:hypothetical protein DFJ77DRAFT_335308 [Powellomyces hirtus]|nr:hypothetical protein DFJ77DRAFT_335308 [Powellomyces hirtus]
MDQEKHDLEKQAQGNLDAAMAEAHKEIDSLQNQCAVYKTQLSDLHTFAARKDELEQQLKYLKGQLEAKERQFKETIHNIERKVLQDKNMLKREMLQKVNEAVTNFQRVADQQMAETTKRAIRENMMITSQLKKMSGKTMELIGENDSLKEKVARLRTNNSLLTESEQELAKKNQTHQRVIKMLVEKLKESDKMLELAYDGVTLDEDGNIAHHGEEHAPAKEHHDAKDLYYIFSSGESSPKEHNETGDGTKDDALVSGIVDVCNTFDEMAEFWESNLEQAEDPASVTMTGFIDSLHDTLAEIAASIHHEGGPDALGKKDVSTDEFGSKVDAHEPGDPSSDEYRDAHKPRQPLKYLHPYSSPMKRRVADLKAVIAAIPGSSRPESRADGLEDDRSHYEVAVQTLPLPFAPKTKTEYLLGEVRQWGAPAQSLPQKGLGHYVARKFMTQPQPLINNETSRQPGPPLRT